MIARVLRSQNFRSQNFRWRDFRFVTLALCAWFSCFLQPALGQNVRLFEDNADSIAVVIGNKNYRQTVSVDFAHNDADAMRYFLSRSLGFRDSNIFVLKDATIGELNQMFGTERSPQSGQLWRAVKEGRSNVFVYFSGHGVPDLQTRQPFLLPSDGNPSQAESGYLLDTLYHNLEEVKRKVGPNRQVIVMIDACFTGETGRKGESLITVSAPGFVPARPKTGSSIVKLLATSAASPANWDQEDKLGLFTSRFLLGASGLARVLDAKRDLTPDLKPDLTPDLSWAELRRFVIDSVTEGARRESGREQVPEIDEAALTLKPDRPVPAIERAYDRMRDEAGWRAAAAVNTATAYENYAAHCGTCAFKDRALDAADARRDAAATEVDDANWQKLSTVEKYQEYLDGCGRVCAYRDVAKRRLAAAAPVAQPPRPGVAAPVAQPPEPAADDVAWSLVKDTHDPGQLRRFIAQFPSSQLRRDAEARLALLTPVRPPDTQQDPCARPVTVSFPSRCAAPLTAAQERALKPKDSFKECEKCPEMVVVPAGSFIMGSPNNEKGRDKNEGPQHRVTFDHQFAVGKFAVTFEEWDACIADGGCGGYRPDDHWGRGRQPVIYVSWDDAKGYMAWLSRKTGKSYRLLSEAEREYVARAGTTTLFWWGNSTYGGPKGEDRLRTVPVDSFQPNPWDLYQVHGNVGEWTEDCYHDSYDGAPSNGSAWTAGDCILRVIRGGSWGALPRERRAASRDGPTVDIQGTYVGFRVGRTLTP